MKRLFLAALFWPAALAAAVIDVTAAPGVPVAEPDLLAVLEARVQEASDAGLFWKAQEKARGRFRHLASRPVNLRLAAAQAPRTTRTKLASREELKALENAAAAFSRTYLFFDADDVRHRRWVLSELERCPQVRPVAVAGDLAAASRRTASASLAPHRLFADQGGVLARRFSLVAVPARVRLDVESEGAVLEVTEIPMKDDEP